MRDLLLEALTRLELQEAELLSWGATGGRWRRDEVHAVLAEFGDPAELVEEMTAAALLVEAPDGTFRTRSAETMRLLSTLRQSFPSHAASAGSPLVLDYRYVHRARRRPRRDIAGAVLLQDIRTAAGAEAATAAAALVPGTVSGFQARSTTAILKALAAGVDTGVIVTAGTGSGKTLAFYLPLLAHLASRPQVGTFALALYPRNELLKDQLRALLLSMDRLSTVAGARPLSVATWFGDTPLSAYALQEGWASGWVEKSTGFVCPFLRCLRCNKDLLWSKTDLRARPTRERLTCIDRECGYEIAGDVLRLTREGARRRPADVMLSSTESLNRQLASPTNLAAFGVTGQTLQAVLLDEVHVYEGASGAQNALLLRRLRHALGRPLAYVGLSATLRNAGEFFARLVDLPAASVDVVEPDAQELEEAGAEYLVALRHDPNGRTGVLSASIQACMALSRSLDGDDDPFDPPPSSGMVFGSRLFAFADKLDSTNRLYWDLLNAEGQAWPGRNLTRSPLTLAHMRSRDQSRLPDGRREPAEDRDVDGQWWWMPEHLGHRVEGDVPLRISRTSSQDRGVAGGSQVVVATASLEVGFDDERVGAVLQHKAPHDSAQFLQRKGRAGRLQRTRPWTVVVLGNWGADRRAWEAYDALFDPELPPRNLPLENRYVLKIQAVYALLDWLASQVPGAETWTDLSGPAALLSPRNADRAKATLARQRQLAEVLARLLRTGPERDRLRRHLRLALSLGPEDVAAPVLDSILWDAPRPLLLSVIPTMRRRLMDQWKGEMPLGDDAALRTRTPLREFVPGNLFDELLVPDVELGVPGKAGQMSVEHLPALRAMREFSPGNVSRHFGVWATNKRHWVRLPATDETGSARVDVVDVYGALPVDVLRHGERSYAVYSPRHVTLEAVPEAVRDASSVRPEWEFGFLPLGDGWHASLAPRTRHMLSSLSCHLHADGGGARVLRSALTATGTTWDPGARRVRVEFGTDLAGSWTPVALGVDVTCDALVGRVVIPEIPVQIPPHERSQRLLHLISRDEELPDEIPDLGRTTLAEVVLLGRVRTSSSISGSPGALRDALVGAADLLGLLRGDEDERTQEWLDWLEDSAVLRAAARALEEVDATSRSADWITWWRSRHTLTVAQVTLSALASLCTGIDPEDLLVDLLPGEEDIFVISESSPGGVGQIEAFRQALNDDPGRITRALADALRPSAIESLDEEMSTLVRLGDGAVADALENLRRSWNRGHQAATEAVQQVDRILLDRGSPLSSPARKALSTRLAGPGAHESLLGLVARWLDVRDRVRAGGFEVDSRILGALVASDEEADVALRLPQGVEQPARARAVSNVLWPWGQALGVGGSGNPYGQQVDQQLSALRSVVQMDPPDVELSVWNDAERARVHERLLADGELTLRVPPSSGAILRQAMLDLLVEPVDVGAVLAHPIVVGVWDNAGGIFAHVALREAS